MSRLVDSNPAQVLEFRWGKKLGRGAKNKKIQFYESFTYDGVDYALYDCVYLYGKDEGEPYIGMLVRIWENGDTKERKVKVHWFFRPSEIQNWIEGVALEKEIFLASGEGDGTASINPLGAISCKCNVVCTLQDERNPQPSKQELELADYFFYRTFDVEYCIISDLKGDKVAGLEVKCVFNRKENKNNTGLISDKKEVKIPTADNAIGASDVSRSSFQRTLSRGKAVSFQRTLNKAEVEGPVKFGKGSGDLENRLLNKSASNGSEVSYQIKNMNSVEMLNLVNSDSMPLAKSSSFADKKMKNGERKDSMGLEKVVKADKSANPITKHENKETCSKLYATSDKNGEKDLITSVRKRKPDDGCIGPDKDPKLQKAEEKMIKFPNVKLPKVSAGDSAHVERSGFDEFEVTRKPVDERSKWFRALPWEERIESEYKQETVLQLSNLDPNWTSSEVEDLIWHAFKEHCQAKMLKRTTNSNPCYGHAHIIMKSRQAADLVFKKLKDGCLILPSKRPLVGSRAPPLNFPGKQSTFFGHLFVDKTKHQMQRDTREAVSTSHFSQSNTSEFELALEWCLLQSRSDHWWEGLNKRQGEEWRKLSRELKLK